MIRLAILDDYLPEQLAEGKPDALDDMEVVWTGEALDDLVKIATERKVQVVILNVDLVNGVPPAQAVERVKRETGVDLVIALYSFLRRSELDAVAKHGRPVKSPASLTRLRSQMLGVLVKNLFGKADAAQRERGRPNATGTNPKPRFSRAQLGKLIEIQSAVQCECPNHVGELVAGLMAFEAYAEACENQNPKDAQVHRMLAGETGKARLIMEDALSALIEHEGIEI
jgi:hypothetical protein